MSYELGKAYAEESNLCLRPPLNKVHILKDHQTRNTGDHLYTKTSGKQRPHVYKDHERAKTTHVQRPLVSKDYMHTKTICIQRPLVNKDYMHTKTPVNKNHLCQRPHVCKDHFFIPKVSTCNLLHSGDQNKDQFMFQGWSFNDVWLLTVDYTDIHIECFNHLPVITSWHNRGIYGKRANSFKQCCVHVFTLSIGLLTEKLMSIKICYTCISCKVIQNKRQRSGV